MKTLQKILIGGVLGVGLITGSIGRKVGNDYAMGFGLGMLIGGGIAAVSATSSVLNGRYKYDSQKSKNKYKYKKN